MNLNVDYFVCPGCKTIYLQKYHGTGINFSCFGGKKWSQVEFDIFFLHVLLICLCPKSLYDIQTFPLHQGSLH